MKQKVFFALLTALVVLLIVGVILVTPAFAEVATDAKLMLMLLIAILVIVSSILNG